MKRKFRLVQVSGDYTKNCCSTNRFFCKETNKQTSKLLSKQGIASWGGRIRTQFGWHCRRSPVPAPRTIMSVCTISRTS